MKDFLREFLELCGANLNKFRRCLFYDPSLDRLYFFGRDASNCEQHIPGTNIILLLDAHTDEIVGVCIEGVSSLRGVRIEGDSSLRIEPEVSPAL